MSGDLFETDCAVIGAGVVGLAVAARLAERGRDVVVLERNGRFGEETSARNSEVIHAGIYYPAGSWKARLCPRGREMLYRWCARHGVAHRRIGKLIVATVPDETSALDGIEARARAAEAPIERLSRRRAQAMEPALRVCEALHSPETGIVDSHGFMLSLLGALEAAGGALSVNAPVLGGALLSDGVELQVGGAAPARLRARLVVNAAGLWAQPIAAAIEGAAAPPPPRYVKGVYFALSGATAPFRRLIYPTPPRNGLGVHLTLDLAGAARFGPDVEILDGASPDALDYRVDPRRAARFAESIRRYWPGLPDGALRPDYAGVRPQLSGPAATDFTFRVEHDGALAHLFGIESPGLTAALAIAEQVDSLLAEDGRSVSMPG